MPTVGFFCPGFFRPAVAAPSDPTVLEVARAIYFGGRAEGPQGMESVAHMIQNRMNNPAFPSDALGVVSAGGEQFQQASRQPTPSTPGTSDKQAFDRAKSMAAQLIYPPHRLSFPDPTGGKLHSDFRGANDDNSALESNKNSNECEPLDELSDDGDLSPPPSSPRPILPTRSRRPLAFLREQSVAGVNVVRRPYVDGGGSSTPTTAGESPATATSSTASAASPNSKSSLGHSGRPAAAATVPATHSGDQPVRPSTPPPIGPPSSSTPNPSSTLTVNTPPASSRLIGRHGRNSRSGASLRSVRLGPADQDGYHDMILPCGLLQDEVIEFMYRDLSPEDFEKLCKLDERLPKRNTAQRNLVDSLPRVLAKDCGVTECSVCLGNFESQQSAVKLPCSHCFHHACISKWLTQCKNTCPLCSAPITSATSAPDTPTATTAPMRSTMRTL